MFSPIRLLAGSALVLLFLPEVATATPTFVASGALGGTTDLSGLNYSLENGVTNNTLAGIGSGLAWAGGNTFVAVPDRGPNSPSWNGSVDDTTSWTPRFDTLTLALAQTTPGAFTLTPTLNSTTLLYSATPLNYAAANVTDSNIAGTPQINTADHYYFSGRSDNFSTGTSLNPNNARLDTEAVRVSGDGKSIFVSDEYGPYIYQFDRATGQRLNSFVLPSEFGISKLYPKKKDETDTANNPAGRVTNAGMESLAITPDGKTLVGLMQGALLQDGGSSGSVGRADRIVTIDIATGATHEYVYDNYLADVKASYGVNEILAINSHQFLVLERDTTGKGDNSAAAVKRLYEIDLTGATDVEALNNGAGISGESNLRPYAVSKRLFLDIPAALEAQGVAATNIPAKFESIAFGADVTVNGNTLHTLYASNDNDFDVADNGLTQYFAFTFTDADLGTDNQGNATLFQLQNVPEPGSAGLLTMGGLALATLRRRKANVHGSGRH